ncbi:unnamed protein product, partial [Ilex paraguariensis]
VYHHFGNATVGPPDPYSEVRCSVCLVTTDESLLLLCDLCDSASHTYCVGLGATVPEGDWFCQDCTLLRAEHSKNDIDTKYESQASFWDIHKVSSVEERTSVFDIVREASITEVGRSSTTASRLPSQFPSFVVSESGVILPDNVTGPDTGTQSRVACNSTEVAARTLGHCRSVHDRIRTLRANWNAFRSGSLSFSCSSVNNGDCTDQKSDTGSVLRGRSGQTHPASYSSPQLTAEKDSSCDMLHNRGSLDVDKAWKMMAVAKSLNQGRGESSMAHQALKQPSTKVNSLKEPMKRTSRILPLNNKQFRTRNLGGIGPEKHYQYYSLQQDDDGQKSQMFQNFKQHKVTMRGVPKFGEGSPTTCSPGYGELPSSKNRISAHTDARHCDGELLVENMRGAPSNDFNECGGPCTNSPIASLPVALNISHPKLELCASSSSSKTKPHGGKRRKEKCFAKSKAMRDDAKSEIQSLVKLNLKLLGGYKLEVGAFKEVARLATHSILASCGLEHLKPGVPSFPSSVCYHGNDIRPFRRSTLMPGSCRECFYVFVKDVVNSIMLQRAGGAEMSC